MKSGFCVLLGCLFAGMLAAQEEAKVEGLREWTSVNGNVLEAAFVREEGGKVFLRRADGSTISTAREKLSPNDLTWIDERTGKADKPKAAGEAKTQSFKNITSQAEKVKLETYLTIRSFFVKTYGELKDNHHHYVDRKTGEIVYDKSLAFLLRDAPKYGWSTITAECHPLPNGLRGMLKTMTCYPPTFLELREAVQIMRDKFRIVMEDPVVMKEIREGGMTAWEAQNPPDYISRILLVSDSYSGKVSRFIFHFPEPEK